MYLLTSDTESKKLLILGSMTFLTVQILLVCGVGGDPKAHVHNSCIHVITCANESDICEYQ